METSEITTYIAFFDQLLNFLVLILEELGCQLLGHVGHSMLSLGRIMVKIGKNEKNDLLGPETFFLQNKIVIYTISAAKIL